MISILIYRGLRGSRYGITEPDIHQEESAAATAQSPPNSISTSLP
jgi:hypothetical protein